nr:transmembrane protein 33 homolog [Ipomoea batatas]
MGGGEDPQRLKKVAAAAYDYENDPRWADYWSNVFIPPHMASRSDVVDHFKRKFYKRYIDPDLVVEPMNTGSSSQQAQPSPSQLMYHAPATASYHKSAWTNIGMLVNPHIQRYAPFLNGPISAIQRWWFR